jgi:hypothetical protein
MVSLPQWNAKSSRLVALLYLVLLMIPRAYRAWHFIHVQLLNEAQSLGLIAGVTMGCVITGPFLQQLKVPEMWPLPEGCCSALTLWQVTLPIPSISVCVFSVPHPGPLRPCSSHSKAQGPSVQPLCYWEHNVLNLVEGSQLPSQNLIVTTRTSESTLAALFVLSLFLLPRPTPSYGKASGPSSPFMLFPLEISFSICNWKEVTRTTLEALGRGSLSPKIRRSVSLRIQDPCMVTQLEAGGWGVCVPL